MYTIVEQPSDFETINSRSKLCVQDIIKTLTPRQSNCRLERGEISFLQAKHRGRLYLIKEGKLTYSLAERALFFFDEGDLVGVEQQCGENRALVFADFAVVVDEYLLLDVLQSLQGNAQLQETWNRFLAYQMHLFAIMLSTQSRKELVAQPEVRTFEAGDKMIIEGQTGEEVYTLLEGHAEVFVGDVKVGEVLRDEVFGVLAAVTATRRSATVVATETCMVLALPSDRFLELIESRPATVLKMIEDMARAILDLNQRVVGLSRCNFV